MTEPDSDKLRSDELVPAEGGEWRGLLYGNPSGSLPPTLTWSFAFTFARVDRDYGDSPVSVDIDWVPLPTRSWRTMSGQSARIEQFAEPAEASVYFFQHHRYERIDLQVLDQHDTTLHVTATLSGDLDGLGIDTLTTTGWLTFAGITVQLGTVTSPQDALARLQDFTEVAGLAVAANPTGRSFTARPGD
jgi:hypothetical protein